MKLYYLKGACSLATHIVLAWLGQPYSLQEMSRTTLKEPDFLKLNPLGAVPVLIDNDLILTQNAAILEYLAEIEPTCNLLGHSPASRAEIRRWLGVVNADIHRNFGIIFGAQSYIQDETAQAELITNTAKKLRTFFDVVNTQLENKDWVTGSRSIVDPYLYVVLRWADSLHIDLSGLNNLAKFKRHMEADPGVQKALAEEGL